MAEGKHVLPETETAVPIMCQPSEGQVVGVLSGRMTFKVLSDQTGRAYAIVEQQIPAGLLERQYLGDEEEPAPDAHDHI